MTPYETASLAASQMAAWASVASAMISAFIAYLMLRGIREMKRLNDTRVKQADTAEQATKGMLTALERQGAALAEIVRRTSPPSSQAGPRPGPAG